MYTVEIKSSGQAVSTRTSNPDRIVESTLDNWKTKGFWVQMPLPGYEPVIYKAYLKGTHRCTLTIRKDEEQNAN